MGVLQASDESKIYVIDPLVAAVVNSCCGTELRDSVLTTFVKFVELNQFNYRVGMIPGWSKNNLAHLERII